MILTKIASKILHHACIFVYAVPLKVLYLMNVFVRLWSQCYKVTMAAL